MDKQLNYSTRLDVSEIEKGVAKAIASFKSLEKAAKGVVDTSQFTGQKSMTQAIADATKANAEYAATLEQERLKSIQLKNLKDQIRVDTLKDNAQIKKNTLAQQEYNIARKAQASIEKELAAQAAVRAPTQISDSQAEINAANASNIGSAATGPLQRMPDLSEIKAQLALVEEAKAKIVSMNEAGTISTEVYSDSISKLTAKESELLSVINEYGSAQANIAESTQAASVAIEEELGFIEGLKLSLKELNAMKITAAESDLPLLNKEIQATEIALAQASNIGKEGFDEMGNKIKAASTAGNGFISTLKTIAVYSGIAFAISKISSFISGVIDVSAKVQGVQAAFDKINSPDLLNSLRTATKGTLSDLLLMQKAVLASSEGFPIDKLSTFYQFALVKSKELGESTDDVLKKLVDGTLKNSTRVFTSLGISKAELQDSFKQTGDFTGSVLKLIQQQLKDTGDDADNTADKLSKVSATVTDIEANIGKSSTGIISFIVDLWQKQLDLVKSATQEMDDRLAELGKKFAVQDNSKLISDFTNDTASGRASAISGYEALIKKQTDAVAQYDQKISDTKDNLNLLQRIGRAAFTNLNEDLENRRNTQVVLLNEYKGELASLNGVVDEENRKKEQQRLIDDANAKARLKALKEEQTALESLRTVQTNLNNKILEFTDKYSAKYLTSDQASLTKVSDDFKELTAQVVNANHAYDQFLKTHTQSQLDAYNANPANKTKLVKTDPASLLPAENTAIDNQANLNETAYIQADIEKKKKLYADYESYKTKVGSISANAEYEDLLKSGQDFETYLNNIKNSVDKLDTSGPIQQRVESTQKELNANTQAQQKALESLLIQTATYEQKRQALIEVGFDEEKKLNESHHYDQAAQVARDIQEELTALDEANFKKLDSYKQLFNEVSNLTRAQAEADIKQLYTAAAAGLASGKLTTEAYITIINKLDQASLALKNSGTPQTLQEIGSAFSSIASSIGGASSALGSLASSAGVALSSLGKVEELQNEIGNSATKAAVKTKDQISLYTTAITGALDIVGNIISASAARKAADQAYYDSVIKSQNEYNLALDEQVKLQYQTQGNIFIENYAKELESGAAAYKMASSQYSDALKQLSKGQAITGQINAVSATNALKSAGAGAASGAAIGALVGGGVLSVPAAAAGAIIGGLVGAIGGIFGGKKKENALTPLLQAYPELIKANGEFNEALAKSLVNNNQVDDATKSLLNNVTSYYDEEKAALDQINSALTSLVGDLGTNIENSLVTAFEEGTDAFTAFKDAVSQGLGDLIKQMLFDDIFAASLDKLNDSLKATALAGGSEQEYVSDIIDFLKEAGPLAQVYTDALSGAEAAGKNSGLDIFPSSTASNASVSTAQGAIQQTLTEDTATRVYGVLAGTQVGILQVRDAVLPLSAGIGDLYQVAINSFNVSVEIAANTRRTADNTDGILPVLKDISNNTKGTSMRGAGLG